MELHNKKIVVALGGNALQSSKSDPTAEAQLEVVKETCERLADMSEKGYELAVVHGNGPQVGRILLASEKAKDVTPVMPFDVCGAMSQGYIGYHLQQALKFALKKRGHEIPVATILTQVVVDSRDSGFENPTKPIGPFYSEMEAKDLVEKKGYTVKEDAGRGYRRVVASPIPQEIIELDSVKRLFDSTIVITCGGGGIPVVRRENGDLEGVAAVIDKDFAAELLAENINADVLMILTEVEKVAINFNKTNQQDLTHMTYAEAERYCEEKQFAPGSMLPKIQACMKFVKANPNKKAIIASLSNALNALEGKSGTLITFA